MTVSVVLSEGLTQRTALLNQIAAVRWREAVANRRGYTRYLQETYHYVVASVPLMELVRNTTYASSQWSFAKFLDRHIREEQNHDRWILDDLAVLGVNEEMMAASLPLAETANIAGSQYHIVNHLHPVGILGYMFALEGAPTSSKSINGIRLALDLPERAVFTLRAHSEEDVQHRRELLGLIDSMPLRRYEKHVLLYSADTTLTQLCAMLAALKNA